MLLVTAVRRAKSHFFVVEAVRQEVVKQRVRQSQQLQFVLHIVEVLELVSDELFGQGGDVLLQFCRLKVELNSLRSEGIHLMLEEIGGVELYNF